MDQWLREHFTSTLLLAAVFAVTRYGPRVWQAFTAYRAAVKLIHETERDTADAFERAERAKSLELAAVSGEHKGALRKLAEAQAEVLELTRKLEIKDDLNRQDRIAQRIYRRNLKECSCDLTEIDREIRREVERYFYERNAPGDK
jgi:hypothetical protein